MYLNWCCRFRIAQYSERMAGIIPLIENYFNSVIRTGQIGQFMFPCGLSGLIFQLWCNFLVG